MTEIMDFTIEWMVRPGGAYYPREIKYTVGQRTNGPGVSTEGPEDGCQVGIPRVAPGWVYYCSWSVLLFIVAMTKLTYA